MLIFGWLLFGLAGLFAASAMLSMNQPSGSYVSPYGALTYLLTGTVTSSKWPWAQASLSGILEGAAKDVITSPVTDIVGALKKLVP